jgi:hypothetical protein
VNEMQLPYASVWAWCDNNNSSLCDNNCNLLSKVVLLHLFDCLQSLRLLVVIFLSKFKGFDNLAVGKLVITAFVSIKRKTVNVIK